MMEGIVTEGTGKEAALNGYSAGGKTGTAQKIDVLTHTYSKTKHVASFAGMAPVSNPAITVAVVIDSPSAGGSYYGAEVSAPVFQRVAQEVLEYLGVPHDQPLKTKKELLATAPKPMPEDAPSENVGDLNAMFAEINNLPADDPLRGVARPAPASAEAGESVAPAAVANATATSGVAPSALGSTKTSRVLGLLPAKVLAAFTANGGTSSAMPDAALGNGWPCLRSPAKRCAWWWRQRRASACGSSRWAAALRASRRRPPALWSHWALKWWCASPDSEPAS